MFVVDAIDPKAETEGLWSEFMGAEFKISSASNSGYQKRLAKMYLPYRRKIEQGKLDPEIGQELIARALAGNILKDWKGVYTSDGKELKFSVDAAKDALQANEDLRDFVLEQASDISNFRTEFKEETAKK